MPRESKKLRRERAIEFCRRMGRLYPHVESALEFHDAFSLVICVLLSAQTTDVAVNKVTPELFRRWPTPEAMSQADPAELGEVIRTIGFWRSKAAHCVGASQMIVADYGGEVPGSMEELTRLPGVGRKTAERLCFELRNLLPEALADSIPTAGAGLAAPSRTADTVGEALRSLGFAQTDIGPVLSFIRAARGEDFERMDEESLLKAALKELQQGRR